jgi:biopolymer transport protein ExbD
MQIKAGTEPDPEPMVDINTTPLVDVLLVLLVMLIITIPIQLHSVNLEMPGTNTPPPPVQPKIVEIEVTPAGQYLWNGEMLADRGVLEQRMREAATQSEQPEIHLRPDKRAKYENVAAALSSAQRLGLQKIGLVGDEQFTP